MAYSGGQQVFSPYAAMGNSPGMMIDPNGEKTKYADPVTGDAIVDYGGMDAVTLRAYWQVSGMAILMVCMALIHY